MRANRTVELGVGARRRGLGLTPLIDVVFILVVFFMLVSQLDKIESVAVTVPGTKSESGNPAPVVLLRADGGLEFEGATIAWDQLSSVLVVLPENSNGPSRVAIAVEADVSLQKTMDLMAALRRIGFTSVALASTETRE